MKNVWDTLFDDLSAGRFIVSATEETVKASKKRRLEQGINYEARGRKADKSWKTRTGIEIAWQEAGREDAIKNPRKFSANRLKVLKGVKDMIDFAIEETGQSLEMFGIVTSGIYILHFLLLHFLVLILFIYIYIGKDAKIFSMIRMPSGIYLAKTLAKMTIEQSFLGFKNFIAALDMILKWLVSICGYLFFIRI